MLLVGCSTERILMPTPQLFRDLKPDLFFRETPPERKRPDVDLLFITDRAPETDPDAELPYGQERSRALTFGRTIVQMGDNLDWTDLAQQSRSAQRTKKIRLRLGETTELERFPSEPYGIIVDGPRIRRAPEAMRGHREAKGRLYQDLSARLRIPQAGRSCFTCTGSTRPSRAPPTPPRSYAIS